jgi:hypothetical protein
LKVFKLFHRAGPVESVKTGSKAGYPHPSPLHRSMERELEGEESRRRKDDLFSFSALVKITLRNYN